MGVASGVGWENCWHKVATFRSKSPFVHEKSFICCNATSDHPIPPPPPAASSNRGSNISSGVAYPPRAAALPLWNDLLLP